jgi:small membrane protein
VYYCVDITVFMTLVQFLTPLFAFLMILKALSRFKKRQQTLREFIVWLVVWIGIGAVGIYPPLIDVFPAWVGFKSGVNLMVFFGMIVLFYAVFSLVMKVEELEKKIVDLNREQALKDTESDTEGHGK